MLTRRRLLAIAASLAATAPYSGIMGMVGTDPKKKFYFGACDWSIGKGSNIEAFDVAKQIGVDGIMVSMGSESNNMHLRDKKLQQTYLDASRKTNVKISSLAVTELNRIPYKSDSRTIEWVWDSIGVAVNLGVTVSMLPFFDKNDLRNDDQGKKEVIKRLKQVAPHAEKNGIIIGLESYLSAAEHLQIIEQVGSKNIKAYMDFRNTADAGLDVFKELRLLGKNNICELHMKENGFLLGQGTLSWAGIRDLINELGYYGDGWMQIEGAKPPNTDLLESYKHNLRFLKDLFD